MKSHRKHEHHSDHSKGGPPPAAPGEEQSTGEAAPISGKNGEAAPSPAEPQSAPEQVVLPMISEEARLKDQLMRLQADFDNYRKRMVREQNEIGRRALDRVIREFLPVSDNLERALQQSRELKANDAFISGIEMVLQQFRDVLKKCGVIPIEALGRPFDPLRHEAISRMVSGDHPEETVLVETQRGYMLGGDLLRAAQVVVSTRPPDEAGNPVQEGPDSDAKGGVA